MPSTDLPITNDILISFDPLINENDAMIPDAMKTESTNTSPKDHVNVILENGSLTQLTMTDLQALPRSQRYCHIDDTYYILPNYVINKTIELLDTKICTPPIEKVSLISRLRNKLRSNGNTSDQQKRLFGIPLDELSPFPPPFLTIAFTCILQHPSEGVYRLSAAASAVTKATNILNANPSDTHFLNVVDKQQSPILAAALIKSFIRQIPRGLLSCHPTVLADAITAFTEHSNENKLLTLLHSLTHRNAIITRQLFDHLNTLLAFSESTKMTSSNLATCMGPNLFNDIDMQEGDGERGMDVAMRMTQLGTSLAKWLICDAHRIFDQLPTSHYIAVMLRSNDRVEWVDYGDARIVNNLEDVIWAEQFPLFTKPPSKLIMGGMENASGGYYMNDLIEIDAFADFNQSIQELEEEEEPSEVVDDSVSTNIEEQGKSSHDTEADSNPWEEDITSTMMPSKSVSLENLHDPSFEDEESVETVTVMSDPGQGSSGV